VCPGWRCAPHQFLLTHGFLFQGPFGSWTAAKVFLAYGQAIDGTRDFMGGACMGGLAGAALVWTAMIGEG
jgi:hypothetical protein